MLVLESLYILKKKKLVQNKFFKFPTLFKSLVTELVYIEHAISLIIQFEVAVNLYGLRCLSTVFISETNKLGYWL